MIHCIPSISWECDTTQWLFSTVRFRNFDDRDDGMEASFAQQMKEEARR